MTTQHNELIARLRVTLRIPQNVFELINEAADALEALRAENGRLTARANVESIRATSATLGRDAALARLAEIEKQEPIGYIAPGILSGLKKHSTQACIYKDKIGSALSPIYAAPVAQVETSKTNELETQGTGWNAAINAKQPDKARELSKEGLTDLIAAGLGDTYHCARIWTAWNVGTISQDDFELVDEAADALEALQAEGENLAMPSRVGDRLHYRDGRITPSVPLDCPLCRNFWSIT